AELTDPDDIDALMDAMAGEPAPAEAASQEDVADTTAASDDNAELTDPDDIDALMDAMAGDPAPAEAASQEDVEDTPAASDDNVELTDPDDIDALLASMPVSDEQPIEDAIESTLDELQADGLTDEVNISDQEDIDDLLAGNEPEISSPESIEHSLDENNKAIESFTEEYVAPFLSADFSDLFDSEILDEAENNELVTENSQEEDSNDIDDELDIDALIAEVENEKVEKDESMPLDIGDDILATETNSSFEELNDIDDDILADVASDFDESTLTQLLNDENESEPQAELTPDFTDSNVLADLLAEEGDSGSAKEPATEATEINDIQELDSLDFDELLANIEEEAPTSNEDEFDLSDDFINEETLEPVATEETTDTTEQDDFISVDSLISDTLSESSDKEEPYEQTNIDVGLGDFPEFTNDINQIDVDEEDDSGVAAKLDLAKVYIEIGDSENAEVILEDVVKMGDAEQQFEAQQLLDGIR
ncbi:FimV/HubP family polar landmark protein, partial [Colwelliaceae bacterium 6441]